VPGRPPHRRPARADVARIGVPPTQAAARRRVRPSCTVAPSAVGPASQPAARRPGGQITSSHLCEFVIDSRSTPVL